jgi:hypothetical protein
VLVAAVLLAALAAACGGDGDGAGNGTPDGGTVLPTEEQTPVSFGELHTMLLQRLGSLRANIGSVPPDIRDEVLGWCRRLDEFIGEDEADEICEAVQRAIESADPGLIDRVLERIEGLQQ